MNFFNKSKYIVSKLTEYEVKADIAFTLPYFIWDSVALVVPTTITAKLLKTDGRNIAELTSVITVAKLTDTSWSFAGTALGTEWTTQSLSLKITIDGNIVVVPVVKV